MTTNGEKCLLGLIKLFYSYSTSDGDYKYLSNSEVKTLIEKEFDAFSAKNEEEAAEINKIIAPMDENKDGKCDFAEFVKYVSAIAILTNSIGQ
ncbi:hypothetical protein PAMP_002598 [Pampus punctatissimus]